MGVKPLNQLSASGARALTDFRVSIQLRLAAAPAYKIGVTFVRQHKFILLFLGLLVLCSVMVVREFTHDSKHVEIREAFILLHSKGYTNQAQRLYHRLLLDFQTLPNKVLLDDFQRTLLLVDPYSYQPSNLVWSYHWTISQELERRQESTLTRALKLADEQKP